MKIKLLSLLVTLSLSQHINATHILTSNTENTEEKRSKNVDVHRIIENAPNPLGRTDFTNFHHYALQRRVFDIPLDFGETDNLSGLSLKSVHPLFSEGITGSVEYYYEHGEKPPGVETNVWEFFTNADGMPSKYVPEVDKERMCIYNLRRYKLSEIGLDALSAIGSRGFFHTPDQWWFNVSSFNPDTMDFTNEAPDYVMRDHPNSGISDLSRFARYKGAIQLQSNERWCFQYDEPVLIRIKKGKRPKSGEEFAWSGGHIIGTNVPEVSKQGYPNFTGMSSSMNSGSDFWTDNMIQYLGTDFMRGLLLGGDDPSSYSKEMLIKIKEKALPLIKNIWRPYLHLNNRILDVPYASKMNLISKFKVLSQLAGKHQSYDFLEGYSDFMESQKPGDPSSWGKIKKFKDTVNKHGAMKAYKMFGMAKPNYILQSYGINAIFSWTFKLWSLGEAIRNPGNGTEEIVLSYIPGMSDGFTLFIDTSTQINNFHALAFDGKGEKVISYNTDEFPFDFYNKIMVDRNKGEDEVDLDKACFYSSMDNLKYPISCLSTNGSETQLLGTENFVTMPNGYWIEVRKSEGANPFYITGNMEKGDGIGEYIISSGASAKLVKMDDIIEQNDYCSYFSDILTGFAQCFNSDVEFNVERIASDLGELPSVDLTKKVQIKSIAQASENPYELVLSNGSKSLLISSLPYSSEDILGASLSGMRKLNNTELSNYISDIAPPTNVTLSVRFNGGYTAYVKTAYTYKGKQYQDVSGKEYLGDVYTFEFPEESTNISIEVINYTGLLWKPTKTIFRQNNLSMSTCYAVWGTTLNPRWKTETCDFDIGEDFSSFKIYEGSNYQGHFVEINSDTPYLNEMNDKMSSWKMPEGWEVRFYEHTNFTGGYYTRKGDGNADGFNDKISSIRILKRP